MESNEIWEIGRFRNQGENGKTFRLFKSSQNWSYMGYNVAMHKPNTHFLFFEVYYVHIVKRKP